MINLCTRIIEYSFYALFFSIPLVFTSNTSELFEFNKMWVTFALTSIIAAAWVSKMILNRSVAIQKTPLDIPIILFLAAHVIATLISIDPHVSFWGYYSRFNGGLLSILSYIFLYYAFVSNVKIGNTEAVTTVKRLLYVSLASATIVTLWGIPSHFGYDPTCFLIRGTFDVSCWTEAFQPKVRIFSTLGQPNWMAAYLAILLPIALAFGIQNTQKTQINQKIGGIGKSENLKIRYSDSPTHRVFRTSTIYYFLLAILFYTAILFTDSRSGFYGLMGGLLIFLFFYAWQRVKSNPQYTTQHILLYTAALIAALSISVATGRPSGIHNTPNPLTLFKATETTKPVIDKKEEPKLVGPALDVGGTDSGKIRRIVWSGALEVWKNNPLFGSGVETFAFAYYRYRPPQHNLTSEWDFLYNKAHNEFLNYLATTGLFGLGSYLAMIGVFLFITLTKVTNIFANLANGFFASFVKPFRMFRENHEPIAPQNTLLTIALVGGYVSILISNFFGFSVVIANLYLFLIPAFVFTLGRMLNPQYVFMFPNQEHRIKNKELRITNMQWCFISFTILTSLFIILSLYRFWIADTQYALGYNLTRVGQYEEGHTYLENAVAIRADELLFKDELSVNKAVLAVAYAQNNDATKAAQLAKDAVMLSNEVIQNHPNNLVFWKSRVRIFYNLSQLNPQYLQFALESIKKAKELAPTDAKITYNLGVLYGQNSNSEKAAEVLEEAIKLKPDYRDAYYALGLFYHDLASNKGKSHLQKKAVDAMQYILTNFDPKDEAALQALKSWGTM